MIEARGPGFVGLLSFDPARANVTTGRLDQSLNQVQASGRRDVVWYFAKPGAADYAHRQFAEHGDGRERIIIKVVPPVLR